MPGLRRDLIAMLPRPAGLLHAPSAADGLARLRPVLAAAGITRVAVLTGLDTLGIPVAAATRPNSRSLAVHQGKGATADAAKLSAIFEAIECHCAETLDAPLRLATPAELGPAALDVDRLPQAAMGVAPGRMLWVEGCCLATDAPVWVPREMVATDWSWPPVPGEPFLQSSTNGLGAGFDRAWAVAHALCEVIERDAVALWRARPAAWRDGRRLDLGSVDGAAGALLALLTPRASAALWDATSDVGVPVFVAMLGDPAGRVQTELGSCCHPDPDAAAWGALMEAAQSRLTVISGARDDFLEPDYRGDRGRAPQAAGTRAFAMTRAEPDLVGALGRAGMTRIGCVDLTRPEIGVPVVRIVVPGLEGGHTGPDGEYRPGGRAAAAAAAVAVAS